MIIHNPVFLHYHSFLIVLHRINRSGQYQQFKKQGPMKVQPFLLECFSKLQLWICQNQQTPSPLVYFSILIYSHLAPQSISLANTYLLSFLPLALVIGFRYNLMFMTAAFVRLGNFYTAAFVCILTLLLSCNDKYKTYIFIFTLGDSTSRDPDFRAAYLVVAGGLFCLEIYKHFVFSTLQDNKLYFTGFFASAVYGGIEFLDMNLQIGINPVLKTVLVIMSSTYAYRLMSQRIYQVEKTDIHRIKDSRILAFYLQQMEEEVKTDYVRQSKVSSHRRECKNPRCFCHSEENIKKDGFYLRQLYEDAVLAFPHSSDSLLFQNYVKFLVQNGQLLKALYFLKKWSHSLSYYHWIAKLRCLSHIRLMLADLSSSSLYQKQFKYALEYDSLLLSLTMQIYEVLELKLGFWHQAARETPLMLKLQQQGLKIVDSMYDLNIFYTSSIKKYQKKLYSFDATILYAMYLLSTTNFKDYAEVIIKNTSKMLEEVQIQQNNSSETYAIRTVIKRQGMYYIKDSSQELKGLSLQGRKEDIPMFKLIIDNASSSFCKLVKMAKEELIGQELNQLVPDGYRSVHMLQLSRILNFQALEITDLVSSKDLHKAARLPMKVGKNELIMSCISIKIMMDLQEGTSFVSVVKKANDRVVTALVNLDGSACQKQEGFNGQVLQHSEFKKYLEIIRKRWEEDGVIKEERFNMMISAMNFCIAINSPLASHFIAPLTPPLHVEILNESTTRNRGQHATTHDKLVKEIRHMEIAINHDTESTSSSKNSTSAINILSTFSQKNSVPLYRRIILGFLFVITCCLIASVVSYEFSNLAWDGTQTTNNPLNDSISYMKLQHLTPNILGNLWDTQEYLANPKLNATEIAIYFTANSTRPSYIKSIDTIFKQKFIQFQSNLYACLRFPSDVLTDQFKSIFATSLSITNYSITPSAIVSPQQNMTFQSLLMNYLADFNIMSRGIYGNSILLSYTYGWPVINIQNVSALDKIVNQSIIDSLGINLSLAIAMGVLIALLVIPMAYFLRSRLPMHQKIFDLFASIDSEMIIKEIKSLAYISNIIKNYGESSEVLKSNVLDYQENAIYPKRANGSRRSSVNNEIVVGLEKFDLTSEQGQEAGMLNTGRQGNFKKLTKRRSHLQNFGDVQQYVGKKRALQKRKRAGDLDFSGSQSDPKKRVNSQHLIIYIMTLIFIIFLILETTSTRAYASTLLTKKNSIVKIFNDYTSVQLNFLLAKLYLRSGEGSINSVGFQLSYLQSAVQGIPVYDYINFYGYDTVYPNCTTTKKNVTIAQTVCMYNYSYLTLMGQFGAIIKQLFQARYTADQNYKTYLANNQTATYYQILANISAKVFYMQSIDNQLQGLVYRIVDFVYQQILDLSVQVYRYKLAVLVASVSWWALTFLVGLGMLLAMKRQYFKEVYMLTFLNSQMILNNKRVESFLDSINKATSS